MEGSNEAPRLLLQHIASRHVNPVQGNQKSYFLGSDLKKIEELVKETIENPDVVKRHRTRRDRGIKKRKWQTVIGVHGITDLHEQGSEVGVLDYIDHHGAVWTFERRKALCGIRNDTSLSLPVLWFDAAFNAFHYKAVADILPYDTQYDDASCWWLSQVVVFTLVELKFRGQALLYVPATAKNPKHRSYPRYGRISFNEAMRTCIEQAKRDVPTVYQNRSLFKDFKAKSTEHTVKSSTYCMKVTPHLPITPYAHFNTTSG
ncbi:uncharacterized protein [Montipora capricornis]|uniref:uncharacterized protein n=1 Tax=Montipora capricornis TaxID=246305 RepID=UPI0035F18548